MHGETCLQEHLFVFFVNDHDDLFLKLFLNVVMKDASNLLKCEKCENYWKYALKHLRVGLRITICIMVPPCQSYIFRQ